MTSPKDRKDLQSERTGRPSRPASKGHGGNKTQDQVANDGILGPHPSPPDPFGQFFSSTDGKTETSVPHRAMGEIPEHRDRAVSTIREMLIRHHASPEAHERNRRLREAIGRLGFGMEQAKVRLFPETPNTQKGNLAEVVLAEYVVATEGATLPIYRLRYNTNIDQSMKGDDVLAFDFGEAPVRVIVGEAKFRAISDTATVKDIVSALSRSQKGGIPVSLQFVAERIYESGNIELGDRILACVRLFAEERLRIDHVGFLLSDSAAAERVHTGTPADLNSLLMISLGLSNPNDLCDACFTDLE